MGEGKPDKTSSEFKAQAPSGPAVAFFGGSFDPPHIAHVMLVALAFSREELTTVLAVPTFIHPFGKVLSPFEDRLEMARLAFAPFGERVVVSDIERRLGGVSRTLETLQCLHRENPEWRLRLLVGGDVMPDREKWYRFDLVEQLAPPLVMGRKGFGDGGGVLPPVSSTKVRQLVRSGDSIDSLVPLKVARYISVRGLYLAGTD